MTDYSELDREQLIERLQLLEQGSKGEATCTPNDLERVQAEQALRASEAHLASVLRAAPVGIGVLQQRVFQDVNETMTVLTGYSREELLGQSARMLYASDADYEHVGIEKYRRIREQGVGSVETRWRCKDGKIINVFLSSTPITPGELTGKVVFTAENITERKQADAERMAAMERQRDTLVREVHHRIKNNLQGVNGVLRQFGAAHPEIAVPINQAIGQVQSIAAIHGLQGRRISGNLSLHQTISAVVTGVVSTWQTPVHAELDEASRSMSIGPHDGVPLALVFNELLSNAVKHGGPEGRVRLLLKCFDTQSERSLGAVLTITNRVADPMVPAVDGPFEATGLQLVSALLPQQGAVLEQARGDGWFVSTLTLQAPVIILEEGNQA